MVKISLRGDVDMGVGAGASLTIMFPVLMGDMGGLFSRVGDRQRSVSVGGLWISVLMLAVSDDVLPF
ncbi:hypothetical protein BDV59DRAFT_188363 [Aspergillus ambiguus]|uniref:uncharacterized protein n=1 Tax=Aspergillus ambiguus TaxID=176160 RepID=UPI003CCDBCFE